MGWASRRMMVALPRQIRINAQGTRRKAELISVLGVATALRLCVKSANILKNPLAMLSKLAILIRRIGEAGQQAPEPNNISTRETRSCGTCC
jgi:hypothetical protein